MGILGKLFIVIGSVIGSLLLCEFGTRTYFALHGQSFFSNPLDTFPSEPKSILPYRIFGTNFYPDGTAFKEIHDRWGRKFDYIKPKGVFRIVCIGGSTTEGANNRNEGGLDYPTRLHEILASRFPDKKIEVINIGYSAYATTHLIILFALDARFWSPDLVILSENINDLTAAYWPNFTTDYSNKFYHSAYSVPAYREQFTVSNLLFHHFRLYWTVKDFLKRASGDTDAIVNGVKRRSYGENPPTKAVETFESHLRTFLAIAKQSDIPVMLASQPFNASEALFNKHIPNRTYNDVIVYPLQSEIPIHHRIFNEKMTQVAKEEGAYFVDNAAEISDAADFVDLVHYSSKGVEKLAQNYADFFTDHPEVLLSKN